MRWAGHPPCRRGPGEEVALRGSELAHRLIDVLADGQASDVVLLDLSALTTFTDYFVIATVDNARQMRALLDAVERAAREAAPELALRPEGSFDSGWVLLDLRDVVLHLFTLDRRAYYHLEGLWSQAQEVVRIQ